MTAEQLQPIVDFVAKWYSKPLGPDDGLDPARSPIPIPLTLAAWYRLAGERFSWTRDSYYLVRPYELKIENRVVLVYCEGQGAGLFGFDEADLQREDPPVVEQTNAKVEVATFSGFLKALVASDRLALPDASTPNPNEDGFVRHGLLHGAGLKDMFLGAYGRLDIPLWHPWMLSDATNLAFVGDDSTIVRLEFNDWAWTATRNPQARERLESFVKGGASWVKDFTGYADAIHA